MTVKEFTARLEEFDENAVIVFPDHEHVDLYFNYDYGGESDYVSLVGSFEIRNAFTWTGANYGEVLVLDVG